MSEYKRLPPIWVMGLTNATFGMLGGFAVVTVPEMLAAQGVSGGRIATVVAVSTSPAFWACLISPMLDVRFSRRAYALGCALLTALAVGLTVAHHRSVFQVEILMTVAFIAATLYQGAVGGWMGSLISRDQDGPLGAWFAVANIGAGGLMMLTASEVLRAFGSAMAAMLIGTAILLPLATFLALPAPGPDRRLAKESFKQFWNDVMRLLKRREVRTALLLFALPCASFALTLVLGGVGKDYSAGERLVSMCAGVGTVFAGIAGGLLVTPLARRFPLRPLYLGIGVVGSLFTLMLLLMPYRPWSFAIAITGENLFQAAAFAAANAISFETIGPRNPLAATTFTVLLAASNLPITIMGFVDGWGYSHAGIAGSFLLDASLSIIACVLLAWRMRSTRVTPPG